mgnify:FL=1
MGHMRDIHTGIVMFLAIYQCPKMDMKKKILLRVLSWIPVFLAYYGILCIFTTL